MRVREGDDRDIDGALDLWQRSCCARLGDEHAEVDVVGLAERLADPTACFLVGTEEADGRHDGSLVAVGAGFRARADFGQGAVIVGLAHVSMVATEPVRWGEGLGAQLMTELLGRLRAAGFERAQLFTHETNDRARALYRGLGFAPGDEAHPDHRGEMVRLWRLAL
ncbi:MAG: hypothetical protein QOE01_1349 [Actinomycetota bacterium]|jgi:ribosomal protein S18 acetylase RimI-like enzyme|nr:hypothetical protein [Actinomycetota bacterium]